ncbi:PAS domain S-box protein [Methylocystis sp. MJC1]|jgi:PAS domain S-box-containing protein|uniref:PAS domain S-box protein n=1 Tax=Methylocystis sp. MJC1 TaxID=2654282 RepID=UPI0013EC0CD3|nr:PAS domain S-box protein [Methylocystis sp. MJC1]KAF2990073.1 Sensor protein FixL [Methylocystis sp. MJC1]MBU6527670.1 PAS domain S-box protein [Methylocystis sp. MJC1]UZX10606.1 PAS domain S-box protein [Methylocystis sp. MJC1]
MRIDTALGARLSPVVRRRSPLAAYGVALAAVALAAWVRWAAAGPLGAGVHFITFFPAVLIAAVVGGFGVGLFATAASMVAIWVLCLNRTVAGIFGPPPTDTALFAFGLVSVGTVSVVSFFEQTIDRIAAQAHNQHSLIESAPNGIVIVGEGGAIIGLNHSAEALFGYERSELLGKRVEILVPAKSASVHVGLRKKFQRAPETRAMGAGRDLSGRRRDGSEFPLEIGLNPIEWDGQRAVLATVTDITERKQHEERQAILARELEHRVGNIFAVILATIRRTLIRGRNIVEAAQILTQRVQLMADAHAVLSESMFKNIPLNKLIDIGVGSFKDQIASKGVDIAVNARAAQAISFIVHELVTNAVKHGALSSPRGAVAIEKAIETVDGQSFFVFQWSESGGPPAVTTMRKGFGSFILLETPRQFGGEAALDFGEKGLTYRLRLPLEAIR